jgi:flagellar basal-body rod protein FlgG
VETIANNIANANTPGFKKDKLVFKEHLAVFDQGISDLDLPRKEWAPKDFYRSYGAEDAHVEIEASFTDHTQGQLIPTGNPLDMALRGKGFFEILTPNGIRYTRNGIFSIDTNGRLVNDKGHYVLGPPVVTSEQSSKELNPTTERVITIGNRGRVSVNMGGEIFANNIKVGQLAISEFKDIHALRKEGNSFFINKHPENLKKITDRKTTIHQGFVEESNVNAVSEMANLIKANRHFESIQRAIKAYDNITGRGVNEIAKF